MNATERIVEFTCYQSRMFGVLHVPAQHVRMGLLVIGRTGSDRGAVHLSRAWAQRGIASFRFDFRGRGECEGAVVSVEDTSEDLSCAIRAFRDAVPKIEKVVIWGLSEGGAAALLYSHQDPIVAGLVLVNPWIRMELAVAKQHLRLNVRRLFNQAFLNRIRQSEGGYFGAAESFFRLLRNVAAAPKTPSSLKTKVIGGFFRFNGPVCLILSGDDPATMIFQSAAAEHLAVLREAGRLTLHTLPDANHVFSRSDWRAELATWTADWVLQTIPLSCYEPTQPKDVPAYQLR